MRTMKTRPGRRPPGVTTWRDADHAVTSLYQLHYRALVRLAALLVSDLAIAEDIVQDSFAAVHARWPALPDTGAAICFLRRSVVRRSRSAPRLRVAEGSGLPLQDSPFVSAVRALPVRQREILVLRYFADLSEAEIASATGISTTAVRSHAARAMSSLRAGAVPSVSRAVGEPCRRSSAYPRRAR